MYFSKQLVYPVVIFVLTFGAGYILRHLVLNYISKLTEKTTTKIDDIVIKGIKSPFIFWIVLASLWFSLKAVKLAPELKLYIDKGLIVIIVISFTIVASRIVVEIIRTYSSKIDTSDLPVPSLTENIASIIIFIVASLIILNLFGISITPILTALGVGGLAVALALQDTLANFFSGIYIILAKQIRVGDYIELESGQRGYILDIGWRSTRIRELSNNVIIISNTKLSQMLVKNYYFPDKGISVSVPLGVAYDSNLEKVEKVTVEVAREIMKSVTGGVPDFEPCIRYNAFADSSINFSVVLRAKEFADQYLIIHEFIKRLKKRYDAEGINIPFPIRAVYIQNEKKGIQG